MKTSSLLGAAVACAFLAATVRGAASDNAALAKPDSATSPRVEQLMRDLTPDEKLSLLGGIGFATQPVARLGIPSFKMSDGPSGTRTPPPSTAYAAGIGLAASWNAQLAREVGVQLGRDARSRGASFLLGPGVNIYRAPMNGRNFEYFGEDPFLGARMAVGYIEGVQSQGVSATIKHFVGNNSEFARNTSDSTIDERTLREIYLPIFESAVKEAHVGAVMSSYNLTNGTYMSANAYLVDNVLKREWGFDGVYMSDWSATHDGLAAANARLDLEMPFAQFMNAGALKVALREGKLSQATVDDKVARLLGLGARFGWLEGAGPDISIPRYNQAGRDAARESALQGMVLLKNAGLLPLDTGKVKNIAVIGPLAHPAVSTAGGSGHVPAFSASSFMVGLSDALRCRATVSYARGIPSLRVLQMMTPFSTAAHDGRPGVTVETFGDASLSGAPSATRIERQFATGGPGFGGDPDFLSLLDSLPPGSMQAMFGGMMAPPAKPTFERWTGWYTPTQAGTQTLFVQNDARYRVLIDDRLVIDSARIPRAAVQQVRVELSTEPHKVVFEQQGPSTFGGPPFWRVGFVREGTIIEPMAKQLAARADAVILALGFDAEIETEGADREFALPPGQEELIREIAAVNPNVIVVLTSGGSVDVAPWMDRAPAIVAAWYPGQEGGSALASLLLGERNFSGRLPISWERVATDNPSHASYYYNDPAHPDRIVYREGIFIGYRGYQRAGTQPLFPFGFGLSYTTFRYSNLKVERGEESAAFNVSFDVTNTGQRAGADIPQVYVGAIRPKVPRPPRELKGFTRVALAPGETKRVTLPLEPRSFAYYDVRAKDWRIDAGQYSIELGHSVGDIESTATVRIGATLHVSAAR